MVKTDRFSPTLFEEGTCQNLDGPSQVLGWFSQVLGGYILELKLPLLHLIRALWRLQNMYFHWMLAIKQCYNSSSDCKWDPRIREWGENLPLPQSCTMAEDRTVKHMQKSEVSSTRGVTFSFPFGLHLEV